MLPIQHPIIQAPMAGGIISPAFAASVSESGALGSIAAGGLSIDQLSRQIEEVQRLTSRPFQVNLFAHNAPVVQEYLWQDAVQQLNDIRTSLGLAPKTAAYHPEPPLKHYIDICISKHVPIVSFTFGCPAEQVRRLKAAGIIVMGTTTNVKEAQLFEQAGADLVIAQGYEAGGHQGGFLEQESIGLMSLIPQIADAVQIPVVAAGGIRDKRGIDASRILGASYAQLGTRFLMTEESIAHPLHKSAILHADETSTRLTTAFSGRAARGIDNEMMHRFQNIMVPPYPVMNQMTADIRAAAKKQHKPEFISSWSGQNIRDITILSLQQLLAELC